MMNAIKCLVTAITLLGFGTLMGGGMIAFLSDEKEANAWINGHQLPITLVFLLGFALPGLIALGIQKLQDRNFPQI